MFTQIVNCGLVTSQWMKFHNQNSATIIAWNHQFLIHSEGFNVHLSWTWPSRDPRSELEQGHQTQKRRQCWSKNRTKKWQVIQTKPTTSAFKGKRRNENECHDLIVKSTYCTILTSQDNSCSPVLLWCNWARLRVWGIWCADPQNKSLLLPPIIHLQPEAIQVSSMSRSGHRPLCRKFTASPGCSPPLLLGFPH